MDRTGDGIDRRHAMHTSYSERHVKTLVVDDSPTMRRILANSLQRIGISDCVHAEDGVDALAKFDSTIELVISDWNMPRMSGIDFVRQLRARPDGMTVPVLMVTTRGVSEDVVAAMQAGANQYIVKPFTPQVLKEKIDAVVARPAAA